MRGLVIAALVEDEPTRSYVRPGRRIVNPQAVYGSQRGHARALYRRIYGRPALLTKPVTPAYETEAEPPSTSPVGP